MRPRSTDIRRPDGCAARRATRRADGGGATPRSKLVFSHVLSCSLVISLVLTVSASNSCAGEVDVARELKQDPARRVVRALAVLEMIGQDLACH